MPRSAPNHHDASAPKASSRIRATAAEQRPTIADIGERVDALLQLRRRSSALYSSTVLTLERIAAEDDDAELAGFRAREFPHWDIEDIQAMLADLYARESLDDTFDIAAA